MIDILLKSFFTILEDPDELKILFIMWQQPSNFDQAWFHTMVLWLEDILHMCLIYQYFF